MSRKYQVENQLTGIPSEANTFDEIKRIREENIKSFVLHIGAFVITVLDQNEEGGWVQTVADENGEPVIAQGTE